MAGTLKKLSGQRGFTLVELMVTVAMTAMLVAAMYALFGDQEKLYATEEQIIQMQQNARVAMEMLSRDVRMAGFWGCGSTSIGRFKNTVRNDDGKLLFRMVPVGGLNNLTSGNDYGAKAGTDLLVLSYANEDDNSRIDQEMNNSSADLHLTQKGILNIGDIAIVSDCTYTSVFQITNLNDSGRSLVHNTNKGGGNPDPANDTKDLGHIYEPGSRVYKISQKYSWLTPAGELKVASGGFDTGAYAWQPNLQVATIAENIQDLQFEYGVDTDGNGSPDAWQNASQVLNWDQVVAVRIYVFARTGRAEKDYINRHVYNFADRPLPHSYHDGYHRYFLERDVAMRNRWPG